MTSTDIARIERLLTLATGDEKHDESAHSTLDVLWVLYDRILRYDPENPRSEERDRFVLSKGHGLSMAVGMALALRIKKSDRRVFALIGDGECNEGSIWEAILLAGNRQLSTFTCIAINNYSSSLDFGDLAAKFAAFGWVATTINGRDHDQIYEALSRRDSMKPSAIVAEIK
jgi:transketolase